MFVWISICIILTIIRFLRLSLKRKQNLMGNYTIPLWKNNWIIMHFVEINSIWNEFKRFHANTALPFY